MSKDEACKVSSASKHKERKPKKPHYIPRPWGKPYNYKCFQCPFTCMEKSHLYNHMKYSLCKNSLSLLIESDWPYKKGNVLHPDQLRPLQQAHGLRRDEPDRASAAESEERKVPEGEEVEEEEVGTGGRADEVAKEGDGGERRAENKAGKRPESDLLMADVLSLEDQLLRARSVEVEAQLRGYKLSKSCLAAPATAAAALSEQWRLLASGHGKPKLDGAQAQVGGSVHCYPPPPPNLLDYQDPSGLNLSVLGVGYPLGPAGLFSYVNSAAIPAANANAGANAATPGHAQLAQLPFLASAAQLMHPGSGGAHVHADRALLPPRVYYPFLCEHSFGGVSGQGDAGKGLKAPANGLEASPLSGFQPKVGLWKVPALRPGGGAAAATAGPPTGWASSHESPDPAYRLGDKIPKEGKASWTLKRTGAPLGNQEGPMEKKPTVGLTFDLLKNIQSASSLSLAADKLLLHSSLQEARPADLWYRENLVCPSSETSSLPVRVGPNVHKPPTGDGGSESVTALLNDLSKALQEYQEAEHKISNLEKEDLPAQHHLWEHLSKIRSELSHIHQALEKTSRHSDGPLDLSVKRDAPAAQREDGVLRDGTTETEEEEEEEGAAGEKREDDDEEEEEDEDEEEEEEEESERRAMKAALESRKQSLDMLIKMSQAGAPVVSAQALWPSRTTKCEADSSVLLCPDGRPVVFADIPAKRTPSIQRLDAQCPPSPLTVTDT